MTIAKRGGYRIWQYLKSKTRCKKPGVPRTGFLHLCFCPCVLFYPDIMRVCRTSPVGPFDWIRKRDRNALMRPDEKHRLTIKLFYKIKTGILFRNKSKKNIQRINPIIFAGLFLHISHRYYRLPLPQSFFRFRMFCPIYFKYLLGAASNPQT